jgi:tRNA 2-thiouridine synthesizing protein A
MGTNMNQDEIAKTIDVSGKCCPMPIVDTNKAIKSLQQGEQLEILATDPGTQKDIPSWCKRTGNELIASEADNGQYRYLIKKAG